MAIPSLWFSSLKSNFIGLAFNSLNQTDSTYIDDSPNGIFDGDIGTILVKDGKDILYKTNTDVEFTNISSYFLPVL